MPKSIKYIYVYIHVVSSQTDSKDRICFREYKLPTTKLSQILRIIVVKADFFISSRPSLSRAVRDCGGEDF